MKDSNIKAAFFVYIFVGVTVGKVSTKVQMTVANGATINGQPITTVNFNEKTFSELYTCLCNQSTVACVVSYNNSSNAAEGTIQLSADNTSILSLYYKCSNFIDQSKAVSEIVCIFNKADNESSEFMQPVHLHNQSLCHTNCITLLWKFDNESLSYDPENKNIDSCNHNHTSTTEKSLQTTSVTEESGQLYTDKDNSHTTLHSLTTHLPAASLITSTGKDVNKDTTDTEDTEEEEKISATTESQPTSTIVAFENKDDNINTASIIGIIVGVLFIIGVLIVVVLLCKRKRRKDKNKANDDSRIKGSEHLNHENIGTNQDNNVRNYHNYEYSSEMSAEPTFGSQYQTVSSNKYVNTTIKIPPNSSSSTKLSDDTDHYKVRSNTDGEGGRDDLYAVVHKEMAPETKSVYSHLGDCTRHFTDVYD